MSEQHAIQRLWLCLCTLVYVSTQSGSCALIQCLHSNELFTWMTPQRFLLHIATRRSLHFPPRTTCTSSEGIDTSQTCAESFKYSHRGCGAHFAFLFIQNVASILLWYESFWKQLFKLKPKTLISKHETWVIIYLTQETPF